MPSTFSPRPVTHIQADKKNTLPLRLIPEEPLSIRVQGQPYAVVMRTPGDEPAHVAGFCLAEGILDHPDDIETIASCAGDTTNVVTLTVTSARLPTITGVLERRGFVSQTSCGICGKELVEDLSQMVQPLPEGPPIDLDKARHCLETLKDRQILYRETRASHAAALYLPGIRTAGLRRGCGPPQRPGQSHRKTFSGSGSPPGGGLDSILPHQLRTGPESGPGQDPLHPGRLPPDGPGRRAGRFPEHDPGLPGQGGRDSGLLRPPAIGRTVLKKRPGLKFLFLYFD